MNKYSLSVLLSLLFSFSCKGENFILKLNSNLTSVIKADQFSPPVAARIYAYTNLCVREILINTSSGKKSSHNLIEFEPVPTISTSDISVLKYAAALAFEKTGSKLLFSQVKFKQLNSPVLEVLTEKLNTEQKEKSAQIAGELFNWISKRIDNDGYGKRLTLARYTVSEDEKFWKFTPPVYAEPIEPHWGTIKPFMVLPSEINISDTPLIFSTKKNSEYWKQLMEVYYYSKNNSDSIRQIAQHWDCNPFQMELVGHVMKTEYRMTPAGHWIAIASQIMEEKKVSEYITAEILSVLTIAMNDAFIHCWKLKYAFNTVRPITIIHKYIDSNWKPIIDNPAFPEYPSGHSEVSAAAACVLESFFGTDFSFTDESQKEFGLPARSFNSLMQAAMNASNSRIYGGIHFRKSVEDGYRAGIEIGKIVLEKMCR